MSEASSTATTTAAPARDLTGAEKAAVVLMHMDQEKAIQVMKRFTEPEAEEITAEIVRLRRVDADVAEKTLSEFHDMTVKGLFQARGGKDFAVGLLEASFGAEKAAGVMDRLASSMAGKAFEFLDGADPGQVVTLLDGELPQTMALVLAHLQPEQASAVMAGLDDGVRTDVAQAIATMGTASTESVGIVVDALKVRAGAVVGPQNPVEVVGGIQPLVEIINRADVVTERRLLAELEERDPELAEEVRSRMFTFADIVKLEDRDMQEVLRGIDHSTLAMAMKGSTAEVIEMVRKNVSERNRSILDDEIGSTGPVRMSQIEEARAEIVRSIRQLEAAGNITVRRSEEDEYVD